MTTKYISITPGVKTRIPAGWIIGAWTAFGLGGGHNLILIEKKEQAK